MTKIVLLIEDTPEGTLSVKFTSNRPLPEVFEEYTLAEIFAARLHDTIDAILNEGTENETNAIG